MSIAVVPAENVKNGFTIITRVIPAQSSLTVNQQNEDLTSITALDPLGRFLKGEPKALGCVQIVLGVMLLVFGVVLTVNINTFLTVYTGVVYWGALIYISSGCLTVTAGNNLLPCLVKASLVMNVVCAVTAGTAIIILSLDLAAGFMAEQSKFQGRSNGIIGVLLLFSLLQFCICISSSAYGCKATSRNDVLGPFMNPSAVHVSVSSLNLTSNLEHPPESPPEYTEIIN